MKILVSAFLLLFASSSFASTYYIRTDGGDAAHCNGTANVAYSPTVTPNCAWHHYFDAIPPNRDGGDTNNKPRIAGGDILNIAAGSYQFGLPYGSGIYASCSTNWPWDCHPGPVPNGTPANPTKIIGAGSASTTFWGSGGATFVVNLSGSSNIVIQGIEITDHSNCIQNHTDSAVRCQAGGLWAATGISDSEGGTDTPQSSNVRLSDVRIHGMAKFGLLAGHIDSWTLSNVKIIANGFGGWSLDTGPSYSGGTNTISNTEIAWNGCTENYPATTIYGCWGQQSGGYGDGVGSSSASDRGNWIFQDVSVHENTQDGIDFLHTHPSANITVNRVNAFRNAGNQIKTNGSATIQNSIVIGNCSAFVGKNSMQGNNSGGGGTAGDICRAQGDAVVMGQSPGLTTAIANSTIISEGNTIITVPDTGRGDVTSKINVTGSILIGAPDWVKGDQQPQPKADLWYWGDTPFSAPTFTGNIIWNTKSGSAPTGNSYADPRLTNETLVAFDPTPTAATPAGVGAIQTTTPPVVVPPVTPVCPAACVPKVIYTMNANGHLDVSAGCQ